MNEIKSEWQQIEVFITSDGEEFIDDSSAQEHQNFLNQRDTVLKATKLTEEQVKCLVSNCKDYFKKVLEEV